MNTINTHGIDVSVTINGRPVRVYPHQGKYFIESRDSTEYAIEIKNNNWHRVEAVVAVDGLSVINGKAASKEDSGYIISGHDKLIIKGFRKDLNEVGAFKFTKKENSYAAGKGQAENVGVIAVAIYKEKNNFVLYSNVLDNSSFKLNSGNTTPDWYFNGATCASYTANTGSTMGMSNNSCTTGVLRSMKTNTTEVVAQSVNWDHGTTWGQKNTDKVITTTFERESLVLTTELYYNSKENLEAMGIKLIQEKQVTLPRGFPVDFAEPPPDWKG